MSNKNTETAELIEAKQRRMKSQVRVWITYLAAAFVFLGGALMIYAFGAGWVEDNTTNATAMKDIFMTILPVATGVITYWFADRTASKARDKERA